MSLRHLWISLMWSFNPPNVTTHTTEKSFRSNHLFPYGIHPLFYLTPSHLCCHWSSLCLSWCWRPILAARRSPSAWKSWNYLCTGENRKAHLSKKHDASLIALVRNPRGSQGYWDTPGFQEYFNPCMQIPHICVKSEYYNAPKGQGVN